ncbi:tetratricopeptide repeat protein [Kutzneria buriramensis]|uniref:NB-ARC domain-containing protein n=1 Tax=Kutzneria buriramensis TaxID=1045776 RepID=A0A3E0HLU1_9PSEU|nr:tetratricopeptide repeat protein [Kutzneria buriramensis]REH47320.1 NB-ARC domain-containing protein [Kutzneria buriramensis]
MTTDDDPDGGKLTADQVQAVHNKVTGSVVGPIVQAHTILGGVYCHAPSHRRPVPRQLPPAPTLFVGRAQELATLTCALDSAADMHRPLVITAIAGVGGIGKTWLALCWAYQHLERFSDGQLFVDLQGFAPSGRSMTPEKAIRGFLDALGVDPQSVPIDLDAQVGLYRSLVAGKQMLIVLDNARSTNQVVPLLPGTATCTVLITSRSRLSGLSMAYGASSVGLDVLNDTEACDLLARYLAYDRLVDEPAAVTELLKSCAGLPLALGIVAARACVHPRFSLAVLADELRDRPSRLDALDAGELNTNLRTVLSWSFDALSADTATVFGWLSLAPGPDISMAAISSLAALPDTKVQAVLRELENAHLLQQHVQGRYRAHDLVRLFAGERATLEHSDEVRAVTLRRLVDFYLHTAAAGARLLYPHSPVIELDQPASRCAPALLPDFPAALAWFDAEHQCLLAAQLLCVQRRWHQHVWRMSWALTGFCRRRGHLRDHVVACEYGVVAAEHLDNLADRAWAHQLLGYALSRMNRHSEAREHLQQALELARQSGDIQREANIYRVLARDWARDGDYERALMYAKRALCLYENLGIPVWSADSLNMVGLCQARLGRYGTAHTACVAALALHRRHDNRHGEGNTLDTLGYIARQTGRFDDAISHYNEALDLFQSLGDEYAEADAANSIGDVLASQSKQLDARNFWLRALKLYSAQHRITDADRAEQKLADLNGG